MSRFPIESISFSLVSRSLYTKSFVNFNESFRISASDTAIEVPRRLFSDILAPTAAVGVVVVIVLNVLKIVRDGFQEDVREGAQRVSAAILPLAFLFYATVRSYVPSESWVELGQLIRPIPAWQVYLGSVSALLATETFHATPTHRSLMRMRSRRIRDSVRSGSFDREQFVRLRAAERCRHSDCEEWWGFSPDHGCSS